jgi:hypothetical protein
VLVRRAVPVSGRVLAEVLARAFHVRDLALKQVST